MHCVGFPAAKQWIPSAWKSSRMWKKPEYINLATTQQVYIVFPVALDAIMRIDCVFGAFLLLSFFGLLRTREYCWLNFAISFEKNAELARKTCY